MPQQDRDHGAGAVKVNSRGLSTRARRPMSTESAQNERSSSEVNVGRSSNSGHRNSKSASTVVQESAALSDDESRLRHSKRQKSSKK